MISNNNNNNNNNNKRFGQLLDFSAKGNHVKFERFVLFAVSEEAKTMTFFRSVYNKTIIRFGFCDIQNNRGLDKGYQPRPKTEAGNPYLDLAYSGYLKNLIQ